MKDVEHLAVEREYEGSLLGDARRQKRVRKLAQALEREPAASLPKATKTDSALEAAYRFLRNEAVSMDGILAGHYAQTVERAAFRDLVLAVHDTTEFKFRGEETREGLGPIRGRGQGFFGHFTLLVAPGELRHALGVIAVQTMIESGRRQSGAGPAGLAARWKRGASLAEERIDGRTAVVHVMDRECDSYETWSELVSAGHRFVIRNGRKRLLDDGIELSEVLGEAKIVVTREVQLSRRRQEKIPFNRKRHPAREGRVAKLGLSAQAATIPRPKSCPKTLPERLTINFVHVQELETNGDEAPVDWLLATTEPIKTAEEIERVVDMYRSRWVIEEYFKALKTGCAYEKRQLESEQTLFNLLAVLVPIAWRLLLLRSLARGHAETPASEALTDTQIQVLVATSPKKLPSLLTVRDALLAIAALGGHIKNNGEPGWIVLGRGFECLLMLEAGWNAAKKSDQS